MGAAEKIKEIEDEMKKTQKNKNTEYHIGRLKAKLAKLRRELLEPVGGGKCMFLQKLTLSGSLDHSS
jgi:ribosome-interacting GTPase 1